MSEDDPYWQYYVIAYWGDDSTVVFVSLASNDPPDSILGAFHRIYSAFERFICHGHVTEILEVIHYECTPEEISGRCDWWKSVLEERGYEIDRRDA